MGIHFGALGEVIEGRAVLGERDARPGEPRAEEGFRDDRFMRGGKGIVGNDPVPGLCPGHLVAFAASFSGKVLRGQLPDFFRRAHHPLHHVRREILSEYPAGLEGEHVVNENRESPSGDLVRPADAAVVRELVLFDEGMDPCAGAHDLALSEILYPPVVVKGEDPGQPPPSAPGLEEVRPGPRTVGELPLQCLDFQSIMLEALVRARLRGSDPGGRVEHSGEPPTRLLPPCFGFMPPLVSEGQYPRRLPQKPGCPWSVRSEHVSLDTNRFSPKTARAHRSASCGGGQPPKCFINWTLS